MAEENKDRTVFSPQRNASLTDYYTLWYEALTLNSLLIKNSFDSIFQLWKKHFWREEIINQHLFYCSKRGFRNIPRISSLHPYSCLPFKILWIIWNLFFISLKIQSSRCRNSDSEITMLGMLQNFSFYKMNARPYQSNRVEQHQMVLPPAPFCPLLQMLKGTTVAA